LNHLVYTYIHTKGLHSALCAQKDGCGWGSLFEEFTAETKKVTKYVSVIGNST